MIDCRQGSHRALKTGLTLLAFLLFDGSRHAHAEAVEDAALAFVQERHLGNGLAWLGYQVASRTAAFTTLVERLGKTEAQTLVQKELQQLQPEYQAEWDRNLATAYAHSFSVDELRSLNQGDSAPSQANRLKAGNSQVGAEMKATSSELLGRFASRALNNAQQSLNH